MDNNERFTKVLNYLIAEKIVRNQQHFVEKIQSDRATVSQIKSGSLKMPNNMFAKITNAFPVISRDWLLSGSGSMLKSETISNLRNKIPFYDDETTTIGGTNGVFANTAAGHPVEYIDTGDWFKGATAAIRHYGDSMIEYPPGCILALKEIQDKNLIVWGNDYVIETSEYRITKRIQRGEKEGCVLACSTNEDTYKNGRLIHEPLDVPVDSARFYLVLGYVVKKNGGTMVFSNK